MLMLRRSVPAEALLFMAERRLGFSREQLLGIL